VSAYVYLIQAQADDPRYKIGVTQDPRRRRTALQTGSPDRQILVAMVCLPLVAARKLEHVLHERYDAHRIAGEWFGFAPPVVAAVLADIRRSDRQSPTRRWDAHERLFGKGPFSLLLPPSAPGAPIQWSLRRRPDRAKRLYDYICRVRRRRFRNEQFAQLTDEEGGRALRFLEHDARYGRTVPCVMDTRLIPEAIWIDSFGDRHDRCVAYDHVLSHDCDDGRAHRHHASCPCYRCHPHPPSCRCRNLCDPYGRADRPSENHA
jgi:hypothetical protein